MLGAEHGRSSLWRPGGLLFLLLVLLSAPAAVRAVIPDGLQLASTVSVPLIVSGTRPAPTFLVAQSASRAYAVGGSALYTLDATTPYSMSVASTQLLPCQCVDILLDGSAMYVLIAGSQCRVTGIHVYSVAGAAPAHEHIIALEGSLTDLHVAAGFAYVSTDRHGVYIVDLAGRAVVGTQLLPVGSASSVVVSGDTMYIGAYNKGIFLSNIATKTQPSIFRQIAGFGGIISLAFTQNHLVVSRPNFLVFVDMSDPAVQGPTKWMSVPGYDTPVHQLDVGSTSAYVATRTKLFLIDVSSPQQATVTGTVDGASGCAAAGDGFAFFGTPSGLGVFVTSVTCATHTCGAGYFPRSEAAQAATLCVGPVMSPPVCDSATCCDPAALCGSGFSCGVGYTAKDNQPTLPCSTPVASACTVADCCNPTCGAHVCAGAVGRADKAGKAELLCLSGCTDDLCCDTLCSAPAFACSAGDKAAAAASTVCGAHWTSCTDAACCDVYCTSAGCVDGFTVQSTCTECSGGDCCRRAECPTFASGDGCGCDAGYSGTPAWSGRGWTHVCEKRRCPALELASTMTGTCTHGAVLVAGEQCELSCVPGFDGASTVVCGADGALTGADLQCTERVCAALGPLPAGRVGEGRTPCEEALVLSQQTKTECSAGCLPGWTGSTAQLSCPLGGAAGAAAVGVLSPCTPPTCAHAHVPQCPRGASAVGNPSGVPCTGSGECSATTCAVCQATDCCSANVCTAPDADAFPEYVFSGGRTCTTAAACGVISCAEGYLPSGTPLAVCVDPGAAFAMSGCAAAPCPLHASGAGTCACDAGYLVPGVLKPVWSTSGWTHNCQATCDNALFTGCSVANRKPNADMILCQGPSGDPMTDCTVETCCEAVQDTPAPLTPVDFVSCAPAVTLFAGHVFISAQAGTSGGAPAVRFRIMVVVANAEWGAVGYRPLNSGTRMQGLEIAACDATGAVSAFETMRDVTGRPTPSDVNVFGSSVLSGGILICEVVRLADAKLRAGEDVTLAHAAGPGSLAQMMMHTNRGLMTVNMPACPTPEPVAATATATAALAANPQGSATVSATVHPIPATATAASATVVPDARRATTTTVLETVVPGATATVSAVPATATVAVVPVSTATATAAPDTALSTTATVVIETPTLETPVTGATATFAETSRGTVSATMPVSKPLATATVVPNTASLATATVVLESQATVTAVRGTPATATAVPDTAPLVSATATTGLETPTLETPVPGATATASVVPDAAPAATATGVLTPLATPAPGTTATIVTVVPDTPVPLRATATSTLETPPSLITATVLPNVPATATVAVVPTSATVVLDTAPLGTATTTGVLETSVPETPAPVVTATAVPDTRATATVAVVPVVSTPTAIAVLETPAPVFTTATSVAVVPVSKLTATSTIAPVFDTPAPLVTATPVLETPIPPVNDATATVTAVPETPQRTPTATVVPVSKPTGTATALPSTQVTATATAVLATPIPETPAPVTTATATPVPDPPAVLTATATAAAVQETPTPDTPAPVITATATVVPPRVPTATVVPETPAPVATATATVVPPRVPTATVTVAVVQETPIPETPAPVTTGTVTVVPDPPATPAPVTTATATPVPDPPAVLTATATVAAVRETPTPETPAPVITATATVVSPRVPTATVVPDTPDTPAPVITATATVVPPRVPTATATVAVVPATPTPETPAPVTTATATVVPDTPAVPTKTATALLRTRETATATAVLVTPIPETPAPLATATAAVVPEVPTATATVAAVQDTPIPETPAPVTTATATPVPDPPAVPTATATVQDTPIPETPAPVTTAPLATATVVPPRVPTAATATATATATPTTTPTTSLSATQTASVTSTTSLTASLPLPGDTSIFLVQMGQAGEASALPTLPEMQTLARRLAALLRKHDTGAVALVRHVRVSVACLIPAVRAAAGVLESDLGSERCRRYDVRAAVPEQAGSGGRSTLLVVATTETVRPVATAADRAQLQGAVDGAVGELRADGVTRIDGVPVLRETRHVLQFRRVGDVRAHAATLAAALLAGLPVSVPPVAVVNVTVEAYCREERVTPPYNEEGCVLIGSTVHQQARRMGSAMAVTDSQLRFAYVTVTSTSSKDVVDAAVRRIVEGDSGATVSTSAASEPSAAVLAAVLAGVVAFCVCLVCGGMHVHRGRRLSARDRQQREPAQARDASSSEGKSPPSELSMRYAVGIPRHSPLSPLNMKKKPSLIAESSIATSTQSKLSNQNRFSNPLGYSFGYHQSASTLEHSQRKYSLEVADNVEPEKPARGNSIV